MKYTLIAGLHKSVCGSIFYGPMPVNFNKVTMEATTVDRITNQDTGEVKHLVIKIGRLDQIQPIIGDYYV